MEKRRKKVPGTMWPKKLPISNRSNSSGRFQNLMIAKQSQIFTFK
jgi:hypothetical protein